MALNQSLKGKEYPSSVAYEVGREKIKEFAIAIGDPNPIYTDEAAAKAAGYSDIIAPPTFLTVLNFKYSPQIILDPDLGLDYSRVVHGTQEYELLRPIVPGDRLVATPRIGDIYARGKNEFFTIEAEVRTEAGELVARANGTIVSRGTAPRRLEMTANVKYADVNVGDAITPSEYRVVRGDLVVYAGASGDFNPIHWDPSFAKMVGLPTTIATGMHTMARIGKFVTDWAGDPGAVVKLGNRFTQPVPVPDEGQNVALKGTITEKLDDNTVKISLEAFIGDTNVSQAEALVKLA